MAKEKSRRENRNEIKKDICDSRKEFKNKNGVLNWDSVLCQLQAAAAIW